jgi:release factor glutamine methyltransferase
MNPDPPRGAKRHGEGFSVRGALAAAASRLVPHSDTARLDAELLMAHALGVSREELLLHRLGDPAPAAFEPLVARRETGEPVAYIVGRRGFWAIELEVGPGALVPRPDTETLIEAALAHFRGRAPRRILDLGTGPGTLLLAALGEWPEATGVGIDASAEALAYARRNAERLGLAGRAELRLRDWTAGLAGPFDLILCNPPYVEEGADLPRDVAEWEPAGALFAGPDGLDAYRRLAPALAPLLAPEGLACFEVGAGQASAVAALFEAEGLATRAHPDLRGILRCIAVTA